MMRLSNRELQTIVDGLARQLPEVLAQELAPVRAELREIDERIESLEATAAALYRRADRIDRQMKLPEPVALKSPAPPKRRGRPPKKKPQPEIAK